MYFGILTVSYSVIKLLQEIPPFSGQKENILKDENICWNLIRLALHITIYRKLKFTNKKIILYLNFCLNI